MGQSGRICIAHVISYLDDASRSSALASCLFLNGAVKEYNTTTAGLSFAAAAVDKQRADSVDVDGNESGVLLAESPRRVSDFPLSVHGDAPEAPSEKKDMAFGEDDEDKVDAELSAHLSELEYISATTDCQVQDHEVVASASTAATSIANQQSILDDMDDMEEGILPNKSCYSLASSPSPSYCRSLATPTPSLGGDEVEEEQEHKSPLMASSHSFEEEKDVEAFMDDEHEHERHTAEQENNDDDLESISTMGTKTQLDVFLSNINSSGVQTPLSFVSPEEKKVHYDDYANAIDHSSTREEVGSIVGDDNGQQDDDDELLSIVPTFSQGAQLSSPITPSVTMPSPNPASLIGATRLELGSTNHLGDGSSSLHSNSSSNNRVMLPALVQWRMLAKQRARQVVPILPENYTKCHWKMGTPVPLTVALDNHLKCSTHILNTRQKMPTLQGTRQSLQDLGTCSKTAQLPLMNPLMRPICLSFRHP